MPVLEVESCYLGGQWLTCTRKLLSYAETCMTSADSGEWTEETTEHLKTHCTKNLDLHVYYAPQIEETTDATSDLCAYKVSISTTNSLQVLVEPLLRRS